MPERRELIIPHRAAFPTRDRRRDINQGREATIRQRRQLIMHRRAVLIQRRKPTMLRVSLLTRPVRAVEERGPKSTRHRKAGSIESS